MRPIDADALLEKMQRTSRYFSVVYDVDAMPTLDVAPVVHGHFVHDGPRFTGGVDWWHCSNCGGLLSGVETQFEYCPHCGAKMDGGDSDAKSV